MTNKPESKKNPLMYCETCGKDIFKGDMYCDGQDVIYCEEHAYSISEVIKNYEEIMALPPEDWVSDDYFDTREEMAEHLFDMQARFAQRGDYKILLEAV